MATQNTPVIPLTLDLDMIMVDDRWNARSKGPDYDDETKRLAANIKAHGQETPAWVTPIGGGKYRMLAGFRRYHAIKDHLGGKTMLVMVKPSEGPVDDLYANLRENTIRKNLPTFDLAMRCHLLKKVHKQEPKVIARNLSGGFAEDQKTKTDTEVSTAYVNNLISMVEKLHPTIIKGWGDGKVTFNKLNQAGVRSLDKDEQLDWWEEHTGAKKPAKEGEKGKGKKASGTKYRRASGAKLTAALKATSESRAGESFVDGVRAALEFAIGRKKEIRGVYPVKKPAPAPKATPAVPAQ